MPDVPDELESLDRSIKDRIKDFNGLLSQIESINDKKRQLWKEIYENAITDRQNAYVLFTTLVQIVEDKSTEHAIHGKTLATYIERMSKANDQLIRLAELVAKAELVSESISPDDMFDKIRNN